ncbi:MAG: hypothetical protein R2802_02670 [Flavobacteriaceae bacterium]|nr:hypothetical protein [Mangrovimonas sp.]
MGIKTRKILLIVSIILLIAQLTLAIIESEWGWKVFLNILVPILLIFNFAMPVKQDNKQNK